MHPRALPLLAALFACSLALPPRPSSVGACSAGSDFNPVASADVIVAGVITGWEPAESQLHSGSGFPFVTIRLSMDVEAVFKGEAPKTLTFIDGASLMKKQQSDLPRTWAGSSGACGAFNVDPTGQYALLGLSRNNQGVLQTNLLRTFFIGDRESLSGFRYQRTREILSAFGLELPPAPDFGIRPPSTGDAGLATIVSD